MRTAAYRCGAVFGTEIEVGGRKVPFVMSADGRYAVFAGLEDVTSDPSKAVMEKMLDARC